MMHSNIGLTCRETLPLRSDLPLHYAFCLHGLAEHGVLELGDGGPVHVVGGVVDGSLHQVRVLQVLGVLTPVAHLHKWHTK